MMSTNVTTGIVDADDRQEEEVKRQVSRNRLELGLGKLGKELRLGLSTHDETSSKITYTEKEEK